MANNQEQIESRLCAYLEGELDPEGQVEIEKHLAANPSHRKLLEEVGRTRQFLRALPREAAPADLCEAFTGQLERAVLLDDSAGEEARRARMRIRRWPQYLAVAAVLMISVGLGLLVYFGLPTGADRTPYAVGPGGTTQSTRGQSATDALHEEGETERSAAVPQLESSTSTTGTGLRPDGGDALARGSDAETAKKQNESLEAMARGPQAAEDLSAAPGDGAQTQSLAYGTAGKSFYLVVAADEPDLARRQIAQHLERFNATWEAVPGDGEEAARLRTLALATNVRTEAALRQTSNVPLVKAKGPERFNEARGRGVVGLKDGNATQFGANAADPSAGAAAAPAAPAQQPSPQAGQSPQSSTDVSADTAVAERDANDFAKEKELSDARTGYAYTREGAAAAGGAPGAAGRFGGALRETDELIVARGLTVQQAETLRDAFSRAEGERQTKLTAAAPTEPVAQQTRRKAVVDQTAAGVMDVAGTGADADKMAKAETGPVAEAPQVQPEAAPPPAPLARAETRGGYARTGGAGGGTGGADTGRPDRSAGARRDTAAPARPSDRGYRAGSSPAGGATAPAGDAGGERIQALDSLHVVLADENGGQVTRNVRVDEKGNVDLPEVGNFNCAGMTVSQFREQLTNAAATTGTNTNGLRPVEVKKVTGESAALADVTKPDEVEGLVGRGTQRSRAARTPTPPAASAPKQAQRTDTVKMRTAQREARDELQPPADRLHAEPKQEVAEREEADGLAELDAAPAPAPAPAATSPAAAAVAEAAAEERVDVVIVLRRNAGPAPAAAPAPAPTIAAGDALNVAFGEGYENTTAVTVRDDGTIELESLGTVKVAGRTTDDAARDIEALAKDKGLPADTRVTVTRTPQPADQDDKAEQPVDRSQEAPSAEDSPR